MAGRFVSLQDKLLASMALLLTLALLGGAAGFAWYTNRAVHEQHHQEGQRLAHLIAIAAAPAMEQGDHSSLKELARRMLPERGDLRISLYGPQGEAMGGWTWRAGQLIDVEPPPLPGGVVPAAVSRESQVLVPVMPSPHRAGSRPIGFLVLTLGPERASAQLQRSIQVLSGGALAVVAAVLPLLYVLIHRAFAPIRRLSLAARNVAQGRFETVDIARGDTLGVLAGTFNHMVLRLAEQKQRADEAHARLLEANLNLERKVEERTGAIEAATHRLSAEIAEKEDFLRAISHDLNAPLRNIDGIVTLLIRKHGESLPQEVRQRLERVKKNVEHETSLINDLLELSRIKTRREAPEPVNLEDMMWDLRGLFENDLREQNIELIIETRLPVLHAEKARVRQIFQNLIDNAIKYMGRSTERRISVGARVGRTQSEFWVRDTGAGIAPEEIDRIFYVFRRGANQGGIAGKGVGLASVKSIIENYNGQIWVESQPGRGSTFRFTINGRFIKTGSPLSPSARENQGGGAQAA